MSLNAGKKPGAYAAGPSTGMADFTDADARRTIGRALRLIGVVVLVATPLIWWRAGWQSALLLAVGAAISGSGLFEWLRLMTAILARMETPKPEAAAKKYLRHMADRTAPAPPPPEQAAPAAEHPCPEKPRPMTRILLGFVLRMAVALAALYVSLKFLNGSAYALLAGLAMGVFALLFESLRLIRAWAA